MNHRNVFRVVSMLVIALGLGLNACQPETPFEKELKEYGLLNEDGTYTYGVPIGEFGTPINSPSAAVEDLAEVLEIWSEALGGVDNFIAKVTGEGGMTSIILDYTGTIAAEKAVFFSKGNSKYPAGLVAINMLIHTEEMTGMLNRSEFKMSVAHELAHALDNKSGLEARNEFERSGAAALSAYSNEPLFDNFAETTAAFLIGKHHPVGDRYVREWLNAYLVLPNQPGEAAVAYNPDDWQPLE